MNSALPDLDRFDPALQDVLGRLLSFDPGQLLFLYNQLQAHLLHDATPGQVRALAAPFEREIQRYHLTGSVTDREPDLAEVVIGRARNLLLNESLGLTQADQALVSGYILTENEEAPEFAARTVNDLLASLGLQRINNITAALSSLESQGLLEVTDKGGTSAQGQKRHKLTTAGFRKASRLMALQETAAA